jgi:hypothetical protein
MLRAKVVVMLSVYELINGLMDCLFMYVCVYIYI